MLEKAKEKETDHLLFDMWKTLYPEMMIGHLEFIPFSEFKNNALKSDNHTTDISYEEIESEMDQVIASFEGRLN